MNGLKGIGDIKTLHKYISDIERYNDMLFNTLSNRPRKTDTDYNKETIEDWDADIRDSEQILMNIIYLKEKYKILR